MFKESLPKVKGYELGPFAPFFPAGLIDQMNEWQRFVRIISTLFVLRWSEVDR